jgi:phosphoglucosamine mutase
MTPEMASKIGRATARVFKAQGGNTRIMIGKDTRISGHMIERALVSGICSVGADVLLAGVLPTPGVAFMTRSMNLDAGIVISASHNPFQDNGIKIFKADGFKLSDQMEDKIEQLVLENDTPEGPSASGPSGRAYPVEDAGGRYVAFLNDAVSGLNSMQELSVVLDCANGATFEVGPATFTQLGASVKTLFADPDGTNINHNCGSQHTETLAAEVVKTEADVGFAFDGDGDRVIVVDETGNVLTGDRMLTVCAKVMKGEGNLTNNMVVSTVMSNIGLGLALKELDIEHVTTQVGDRYVLEAMVEKGACIGGEDSGHVIFLDYNTTGDGILTAMMLVSAMKKTGKRLSELAKNMKVFPQRLINLEVKEKPPLESVPEIVAAVERVETMLQDRGRVLVRYSGTQPMCRVMVEGPTVEETEKYCEEIAEVVRKRLG